MKDSDIRALLEQFHAGRLSIDAAVERINVSGLADLGYANVDLNRQQRCGFPEVVFSEGKSCAWVEGVVRTLHANGQDCLATRVSDEQAAHLAGHFPQADQDRLARTFWLRADPVADATRSA